MKKIKNRLKFIRHVILFKKIFSVDLFISSSAICQLFYLFIPINFLYYVISFSLVGVGLILILNITNTNMFRPYLYKTYNFWEHMFWLEIPDAFANHTEVELYQLKKYVKENKIEGIIFRNCFWDKISADLTTLGMRDRKTHYPGVIVRNYDIIVYLTLLKGTYE